MACCKPYCGSKLDARPGLPRRDLLLPPARQDAGDGQVAIVQPLRLDEKIVQRSLVLPGHADRLTTLSAVYKL